MCILGAVMSVFRERCARGAHDFDRTSIDQSSIADDANEQDARAKRFLKDDGNAIVLQRGNRRIRGRLP